MTVKDLISVIVPVYNVEDYIKDCLESIKNQDYENIEVLMINDGSTDNSASICKQFLSCDNRFKLLEQANAGLAMARNKGIESANGEYLCFIDSDDLISPKYISILYENINKADTQISMCSYLKFEDGTQVLPDLNNQSDLSVLEFEELVNKLLTTGKDNECEEIVIACNKLFKSEFFKDLRFPKKLHEDEFLAHEYVLRAKRIAYTDEKLYFYRQREKSIMGSANSGDIRHLDLLEAMKLRMEAFFSVSENAYKKALIAFLENSLIVYFMHSTKKTSRLFKKKILPSFVKAILKNLRVLSFKEIIHYLIFVISPSVYKKRYW